MSHNKAKVLIVDDEQVICDLLHDELGERGYFCTCALNASEALSSLRTHYFDAALVDIRLPGVSGMELLRKMCLHHHNTAVIMITAINNTDTAVEAMRLGAVDYIVKPFAIDKVISSISIALNNKERVTATNASKIIKKSFSPMDAIAYGVEVELNLHDGHSKMVVQRTTDVARWFGIDETEIQSWVVARAKLDCLSKKHINSLLKNLGQAPLAQNIADATRICLETQKSSESVN
jgi:ActR/RegA family two-component response regulator